MSMTQNDRLAVPLPRRLRARPKDDRGYPIPFIVLVDKSGQPQFTINDIRRVDACRNRHLCGLCGRRFDDGQWFIGGSRCFLHPRGAFVDPPNHRDCAEYALRVCPFLAAPSYSKRIDDKKLKPSNIPDGLTTARVDYMLPHQPELFGLGCAESVRFVPTEPQNGVYVVDRWQYVEWWRGGVSVSAPDAMPADQPMERFA